MTKTYRIKNAFYLGGNILNVDDLVELTDSELSNMLAMDVIGEQVERKKGKDKALAALKAGDANVEDQTGDSSEPGTSELGSDKNSTED